MGLPPAKSERLSTKDVMQAMRLGTPALVGEVFALVKLLAAEEQARQARIDAKAVSLLQSAGLCVTLAGVLLPQVKDHPWVPVPLAGAALCALGAAGCALYALRVGTHERLSDVVVFDAELLDKADAEDAPGAASARYQRYGAWGLQR